MSIERPSQIWPNNNEYYAFVLVWYTRTADDQKR